MIRDNFNRFSVKEYISFEMCQQGKYRRISLSEVGDSSWGFVFTLSFTIHYLILLSFAMKLYFCARGNSIFEDEIFVIAEMIHKEEDFTFEAA